MTNEDLSKVLSEEIGKVIKNNGQAIEEGLLNGIGKDDTVNEIIPKITMNSIKISVQLAVQLILKFLDEQEIIALRDHPLPDLHILEGGLSFRGESKD